VVPTWCWRAQVPSCCNDPIVWKAGRGTPCNDPIVWKAGGAWYAVTANHGSGKGDGDYGYESFYTSPSLLGPKANWTSIGTPFFTNKASQLVPGHPQVHKKRAVIYFGWAFFLIPSGPPHVRPKIELTPMGVKLNGSWHAPAGPRVCQPRLLHGHPGRRYASRAVQFHPMGVNPISSGPPHVRRMGVHRTCGA
jgi:hypothetical protein